MITPICKSRTRQINTTKYVKPCRHERGIITNYKNYPATLEQPAEETGTVVCNLCDKIWELGYEPEGMELST